MSGATGTNDAGGGAGGAPGMVGRGMRWPWQVPWMRGLMGAAVVVLIVGGCIYGYERVQRYSLEKQSQKLASAKLVVECVNRPAWLNQELVNQMTWGEVKLFAEQTVRAKAPGGAPIHNYFRLQNPLREAEVAGAQADVLRELAEFYAAHRNERYNAWIERIVSIERVYRPERNEQAIRITAEFRKPLGFIVQGDTYYLVEKLHEETTSAEAGTERTVQSAVQLPGKYTEADHRALAALPVVRGVDEVAPEPGQCWRSESAIAGLKLAELLTGTPYAGQIAAIDVSNLGGKMNPHDPYITLQTVFGSRVWWGRPVGAEGFVEIPSAAKLKALGTIFMRYSRIDARCPYVDIRFDQVKVPTMANGSSQGEESLEERDRRGA